MTNDDKIRVIRSVVFDDESDLKKEALATEYANDLASDPMAMHRLRCSCNALDEAVLDYVLSHTSTQY